MMNIQKPFVTNTADLGGDSTFGLTKSQVDNSFLNSVYPTDIQCFLCGNTASYKLIAKEDQYNTAQIQDRGYVCGNCLNRNPNITREHYDIREIK